MPRILGVEFVPINVPLRRRLQTLSVLLHVCCISLFPFCFSLISVLLLMTRYWFISAGYWLFVCYDHYWLRTSKRGGRRSDLLRSSPHLEYYCNYFPLELVKTCDLDPNRNYILGFHPHGIVATGAFCAFSAEYMGFERMYPGLKCVLLTLNINLAWPLIRDYGLLLGMCDVDRESMDWLLTKEGHGNALVLVVGGAEEALEARPGSYKVVLNQRKGFVKLAIQHGTPLVPVYSFGENNLFEQLENPPGSMLRRLQTAMKRYMTFTVPAFYGRGVFNYTFGFLPRRVPVSIVVGSPIEVPHEPTPSAQRVDEIHAKYVNKLEELFEEHKHKYGIPEDTHLTIM